MMRTRRSARWRRGLAFIAAIGGVALAACVVSRPDLAGRHCPCIDGFSCVNDICVVGSAVTATDAAGQCVLASWPAPPPPVSPTGTPDVTFVAGAYQIYFQAPPDFPLPVYDLDQACTCPGAGSCPVPGGGDASCDLDGGGDDAFGDLVKANLARSPAFNLTQGAAEGRLGFLVRVSGYNGTPNDEQVKVELFTSGGLDGVAGVPDGGVPLAPKFDGTDSWTVDPKVLDDATPPYLSTPRTEAAYVHDGTLVATFVAGTRLLSSFDFWYRAATLVAIVSPSTEGGAPFTLSAGRLGGRVDVPSLLTSIGATKVNLPPAGDQYLCAGNPAFELLKTELCQSLDLRDVPIGPCNTISSWIAFRMKPAKLGSTFVPSWPPVVCNDGGPYQARCD